MAKAAKQTDDITPKLVNGVIAKVLACFERIDSARGRYMNEARNQRDTIQAAYETAASKGVSQKAMKLQVKIEQTHAKLVGLISDLEIENQRMLKRLVKMRGNKAQLALLLELPDAPKSPKTLAEVFTTGGEGNGKAQDGTEGAAVTGTA